MFNTSMNMDQIMWHNVIRHGLVRIFYPCLMLFGTIGNILCLKILLRKRFRRQSTCQYLCILAVIDILFIYMRSSRYLYRSIYKDDLRNRSMWICRIFIYFSSALSHLASWILVIVSFDRYFIVKNLFLRRRHVGWRVIKSTCILILIISIVNLHYLQILGTNVPIEVPYVPAFNIVTNETSFYTTRFVCMVSIRYKHFFRLYVPIFDLLFVAIIPFSLMMLTNIGIIRTTMHSNMLYTTSRKQRRNNRLTIMLLSVTLAFMLLTCPSVVYICLNRLTSPRTYSDAKLLVLDLLEALWYTKHALNFILYTLSGQDFRREFIKLIRCTRRKQSTTASSIQSNQNNGFTSAPSVILDKAPFSKRQALEQERQRLTNEIIDLSPMIVTRVSQARPSRHVKTSLENNLIVFRTGSSPHLRTSINMDSKRSLSMNRTSIH